MCDVLEATTLVEVYICCKQYSVHSGCHLLWSFLTQNKYFIFIVNITDTSVCVQILGQLGMVCKFLSFWV